MAIPTPHFCLDWAEKFVDQAAQIVAAGLDQHDVLHQVRVKAATAKIALQSAQSLLAGIDQHAHPRVAPLFYAQLARIRAGIEHDQRFDRYPEIRNLLLAELTTDKQPSQMTLI